jgi:hypothetical protein
MTPTQLLKTALESDLGLQDIPTFQERSGDSILTPEKQQEYSEITFENIFVHRLTPILSELFSENGHIVVNSENQPWLNTRKPDLFLCPPWVYSRRQPSPFHLSLGEHPDFCDYEYLYGAISERRLFDSVHILDCKVTATNSAIGEVFQHLQTLNSNSYEPQQTSRGMLFCHTGCYLLICEHLTLRFIEFVPWTASGSRQQLLNFFPSFQWNIDPILRHFQVQISEPKSNNDSAFLGSGATGRVIRVCEPTNLGRTEYLALKIVLAQNAHFLYLEQLVLNSHSCDCSLSFLLLSHLFTASMVLQVSRYLQLVA